MLLKVILDDELLSVVVAIDSKEPVLFCTLDAKVPRIGIRLFYPSLLHVIVDIADI